MIPWRKVALLAFVVGVIGGALGFAALALLGGW